MINYAGEEWFKQFTPEQIAYMFIALILVMGLFQAFFGHMWEWAA